MSMCGSYINTHPAEEMMWLGKCIEKWCGMYNLNMLERERKTDTQTQTHAHTSHHWISFITLVLTLCTQKRLWEIVCDSSAIHTHTVKSPHHYTLLNIELLHYNDVTMSSMASQITSLTIVYSTVYSHADQKTSKLRVTGLCVWNSPATGEFPAQRASNAENVSIWWRHHVIGSLSMESSSGKGSVT